MHNCARSQDKVVLAVECESEVLSSRLLHSDLDKKILTVIKSFKVILDWSCGLRIAIEHLAI